MGAAPAGPAPALDVHGGWGWRARRAPMEATRASGSYTARRAPSREDATCAAACSVLRPLWPDLYRSAACNPRCRGDG